MFLKVTIITGTVISLLLTVICIFSLFSQWNTADTPTIIAGMMIAITQVLFLLFNFVCNKMLNCNNKQTQISTNLKRAGKIAFILNIIAAIVIFFCCFALIATLPELDNRYILLFILAFFFLSGAIAVANLFYFTRLSRENKAILSLMVDKIGAGNDL